MVSTWTAIPSGFRLFSKSAQVGGNYAAASATFTVEDNGIQEFDRITLWYENSAYDCIVNPALTGITASSIASYLAGQINAAAGDLRARCIG